MILVLAGRFDDAGGKPSGYAQKLFGGSGGFELVNGGHWSSIKTLAERASEFINDYAAVIWLADIPNDKPKLIDGIKRDCPRIMLVSSKNNLDDKYSPLQIVGRALQTKSNLLLEFTRGDDGRIETTVWDALGNAYAYRCPDPDEVRQQLLDRLLFISSMGRVGSTQVGDAKPVPDESRFFELARGYADKFHELIHAANPGRFLGNLSFRCENGFPSFRDGDVIYVSRRNIDKRSIGSDGFVAVDAKSKDVVRYYGENKPSVDTPIQLRLFRRFQHVRYMLHSHAYIETAPYTNKVIPCGAIHEADAVIECVERAYRDGRGHPDPGIEYGWMVNLKGHGSLVACETVEGISHLPYISRPVPEIHID